MGRGEMDLRLCGILVPETLNPACKRRYETVVYKVELMVSLSCFLE